MNVKGGLTLKEASMVKSVFKLSFDHLIEILQLDWYTQFILLKDF